jgi:hypothetical protein
MSVNKPEPTAIFTDNDLFGNSSSEPNKATEVAPRKPRQYRGPREGEAAYMC